MLFAHAALGCHAALSRTMALRVVIIFRMTATIMTFGFLLVAARRLWKILRTGLYRARHVEDVTDRHATAVDAAMSFELATVERSQRGSGSDSSPSNIRDLGR